MNLKIRFLLNANGTNIFGGLVNVIYNLYTFRSIYLDNLNLLFSLLLCFKRPSSRNGSYLWAG